MKYILAYAKRYPEMLYVFTIWLIVYLSGYIVRIFYPLQHEYMGFPWFVSDTSIGGYFYSITQTWDAIHYFRLGTSWYSPVDHIGSKDYLYAFFPLYPALIFIFHLAIGTTFAMILLSLLLPIFASFLLNKLFLQLFPHFNSLHLTILSFLLPFSLFYFIPYTEATYLILLVSTYLFLFKKNSSHLDWLYAILLGGLLVLCRSVGLLFSGSIFLVYFIAYLYSTWKRSEFSDQNKAVLFKSFLLVFGGGLAMIAFFTHNLVRTGNFFISRTVQDYFGRGATWNPLDPFIRGIKQTLSGERFSRGIFFVPVIIGFFTYIAWRFREIKSLSLFLIAGFVYSMATIYLNITADSLASTNRYMLTSPLYFLFTPVFILQTFKNKKKIWLDIIYLLLVIFLIFTMYIFTCHLWLG